MEGRIFFEKKSVSVLLIGKMAEDGAFVQSASSLCKTLHVATTNEMIIQVALKEKIDLIFGTLSLNEYSFLPSLKEVRVLLPRVELIVFMQVFDVGTIDDALALKCNRYFCMKAEEAHALKHLRDGIEVISHKNVFLKDTQYFNALLESSVVSQTDIEGNITYINENFTKVTGYIEAEVMGKNHRMLRHPSNPVSVYENMWETIKEGKIWRERVLNRNKDGSDFWADTIIIPFKDEFSGEIIQYIAIRRDITQMLEEKRAMMLKEQKAHEQMKLSEAKDSFLILFTHELKTPLNAIINFSQYLVKNMHRIDEIPKEKRMHLLEQIHKSATSMLHNVSNILDLSRLRNQKINFNYTLFNVKESIKEVIERHHALALENHCEVTFMDDSSEPYITSDEHRFGQIMANILSNAIKYGHSKVEIFLFSDAEKIEIIVQDDGKGIVDKTAVFELYEQDAKGITSMEKKGTGIGLNFVKLLCEGLSFEYKIEDSHELGGAKFVLTKKIRETK